MPPPVEQVAAVVVHHRTPALLESCLASLTGFAEVVVVDNASGDGTPDMLRNRYPDVKVVASPVNGGFGAGANLGLEAVRTPVAVILNPDSLAQPELAGQITEGLARHPALWIGGCRLEALEGSAQENGRRFYTPLTVAARRLAPRSHPSTRHVLAGWDRNTDRTVDWVAGNGMVVRREELFSLGGFDERYFMYFEDVDLCMRAWEAGGEVWFLAGARVVHDERRTSAKGANRHLWWHLRSYARFVTRWRMKAIRPPPFGDLREQASSILPPP